MITDSKISRIALKILTAACITAAIVCIIVNFAISRSITWAAYPLIAIPFVWIVALPSLLIKKHKLLLSLAAFSALTVPFLYLLEKLTPVKEWFAVLGVPAAISSIIALWITYFLVKYAKINKWYLSAILVFIYGVVLSGVINFFVAVLLNSGFLNLSTVVNILSCIVVTVLLVIIGSNHSNTAQ